MTRRGFLFAVSIRPPRSKGQRVRVPLRSRFSGDRRRAALPRSAHYSGLQVRSSVLAKRPAGSGSLAEPDRARASLELQNRSRDDLRLQIGLHLRDRFPDRLFGAGSVTGAGQPADVSCQVLNLGVGYLYLHFIVPLRVGIGAPMLARGFGCSKSFSTDPIGTTSVPLPEDHLRRERPESGGQQSPDGR